MAGHTKGIKRRQMPAESTNLHKTISGREEQ